MLMERFYYVRMLPADRKLELYKKLKGYFLFENSGQFNINDLLPIMDEKVKDVIDILDYEVFYNPLEIYKDYSYGRY